MNCIELILSKFYISFENEFTVLCLKHVLSLLLCFERHGIKISNTCVQLNNLTDILRFEYCYIL